MKLTILLCVFCTIVGLGAGYWGGYAQATRDVSHWVNATNETLAEGMKESVQQRLHKPAPLPPAPVN